MDIREQLVSEIKEIAKDLIKSRQNNDYNQYLLQVKAIEHLLESVGYLA